MPFVIPTGGAIIVHGFIDGCCYLHLLVFHFVMFSPSLAQLRSLVLRRGLAEDSEKDK
jgi:hypothetical protein